MIVVGHQHRRDLRVLHDRADLVADELGRGVVGRLVQQQVVERAEETASRPAPSAPRRPRSRSSGSTSSAEFSDS